MAATEIIHRRHEIRTMKSRAGWRAQAKNGSQMVGPILEAGTRDAAVEAVRQFLDRQAEEQLAAVSDDGYPGIDAVRAAFVRLRPRITALQQAMLDAHRSTPHQTLTATLLAEAGGYTDYVVANAHYGQLGRALAEELDWTPRDTNPDGSPVWTFALADDADKAAKFGFEGRWPHEWRWKLRPEVLMALSSEQA